jgi:transposase
VERLAEIPGVSLDLARAIIAETGLDMTRFPTADCLVSWAGLTPVARRSCPRSRKPGKGRGDSYLRGYCTQAATGARRATPSSANGSAACHGAWAAAGPGAPSDVPSSSPSGISSPIPGPATSN